MNRFRLSKKPVLLLAGLAAIALLMVMIRLIIGPVPMDLLSPRPSVVVMDRNNNPLGFFLAPDDSWRFQVSASELDPALVKAVIAYEDRWFYFHPGINPFALVRAFRQNLGAGKIVSGGSTLTMQVARMLEHRPRTYRSKIFEILRALQLELNFSKKEILTFYFNLAPYGGNIQGVAAASWLYFGKAPDRLSRAELALLVALPQSPEERRPDLHPDAAKKGRDRMLGRFREKGLISQEEYDRALRTELPKTRRPLPMIAPHLAQMLLARADSSGRVVSTVDRDLQIFCEAKLRSHIARLKSRGIKNGAVVVIENNSHAVAALVGSPDFFDIPSQGQVNAALAPRSPGSALKPFLYARALDRGLVSPELLLPDVPSKYGSYEPENYDDTYRGMVPMREALVNSLNVPAVTLEAKLKEQGVYSILRKAKFKSLTRDRTYYGLSIILGGCGVNLLELANLYAALGGQGIFKPYRVMESDPLDPGERFFSAPASYIVTDILSQVKRPDLANELIPATNLPTIAWKTGTSYGRRDAWSIGYDPEWTVGVWVGNASGEGNPELVGTLSAAPLLFEIFDALKSGKKQGWFSQPPEVGFRQVCALSGMIPTPSCPDTKEEMFIYSISPSSPCNFHLQFDIDDRTGARLCSHCREGRKFSEKTFIKWPQEVANWMRANNLRVEEVPAHLSSCPYQDEGKPPQIISPAEGDRFLLRSGIGLQLQQIKLRAAVDNRVKTIFWFVDGKVVYQGPPAQSVFYLPVPGRHQLVCMDEEGRKASVSFTIQ